jgi:hypothetical protein
MFFHFLVGKSTVLKRPNIWDMLDLVILFTHQSPFKVWIPGEETQILKCGNVLQPFRKKNQVSSAMKTKIS